MHEPERTFNFITQGECDELTQENAEQSWLEN